MRLIFIVSILVGMAQGAPALELSNDERQAMTSADVVILGELHDNAEHHKAQAALMQQVRPTAVVFEMLNPQMAVQVNAHAGPDLADLGDQIGWNDAGWPDFAIYLPIFEVLGDATVFGAAMPRQDVRAAFEQGAAAIFGDQANRFGLTQKLEATQNTTREAMQFDAHCQAMPLALMGGMVEAQRLRDAHFSRVTLEALNAFGAPVVVITGNGHVRKDWGMPFVIAQAAPDVTIFSVGMIERPASAQDDRFDATFLTDPAPRGDPCAAFNN